MFTRINNFDRRQYNSFVCFAVISTTPYKSNIVKDFSSSVRIYESILMSSFMRQHRKKRVAVSDSIFSFSR